MEVCRVPGGGCGRGTSGKGLENWSRLAQKRKIRNLCQNVPYDSEDQEWPLPDIFGGGVQPPELHN